MRSGCGGSKRSGWTVARWGILCMLCRVVEMGLTWWFGEQIVGCGWIKYIVADLMMAWGVWYVGIKKHGLKGA